MVFNILNFNSLPLHCHFLLFIYSIIHFHHLTSLPFICTLPLTTTSPFPLDQVPYTSLLLYVLSPPAPFSIPILPIPFPCHHSISQHQLPSSHPVTPQCFNWLCKRGKYQRVLKDKRERGRERVREKKEFLLCVVSGHQP